MAVLVSAGITVPVIAPGATKDIVRLGTSSRAYAGNLRSSVRAEKREWEVLTSMLTQAEAVTLEAAVASAAQVSCSGDLLGATITCEVTVGKQQYPPYNGGDGLGFMRQLPLTIREV
jgi:hypothetical protein